MHSTHEARNIRYARGAVRILAALGLFGAVAGAAQPTLAAPLFGPTRPSQLVTLMTTGSGPQAPCTGPQLRVNGIIDPANGAVTPFAIPEGKVFVLTGGTWSTAQADPADANVNAALQLRLRTPTAHLILLRSTTIRTDSTGHASGSFALEPGIVIKPGVSLCALIGANGQEHWAFPNLHGFLTKDR